MSDQNQNPPPDNNTNPPAQNPPASGGSLLNRFGSRPATPPQNNTTPPANQPPSNPFSRAPFGSGSSKPGGGTGNTNPPAPTPPPFRPLPTREQIEFALFPLHSVAVKFELKGLGDPFYRLLGHDVNLENSDSRLVVRKLEQGGDDVKAIQAIMDNAWEKYAFKGASIVYVLENESLVKQLAAPSFLPKKDFFDDDEDDKDKKNDPPKPAIKVMRAIDMMLVLNVLARARTQVLLASSPVMFSQHYLNRALVTDDPRLVALALATGVI